MAKKATYKVFNGNSFEDIYFKTSIEQVEGLQDALSNMIATPIAHTHTIGEVTGLQNALNGKSPTTHSHSVATTSAAGFLSAADKTKLNGIAENATNLTIGTTSTTAKAGNYHPTWGQVTGKPTFAPSNAQKNSDVTKEEIETSLGFTPENVANKLTTVRTTGATNTAYVTEAGIKSYVESMIGSVYRPAGDWNAETNTPTLTSPMLANLGKVYRVSVEGTRFGYTWHVGDKLAFIEGGTVTKWDNIDDVTSVAGKTGAVVLTAADVGARSNTWLPVWSQVNSKPSWIGSSKPIYTAEEVGARASTWTPTWSQVSGKPSFVTVATSGSYNDLTNKPSIPGIPSVMTTTEGNTGTATTQRTINAANLKSIILNHSPAGSRPASDVSSWAKADNKPTYTAEEVGARSNTWLPVWSQVNSKPSWIGSSKPTYIASEVGAAPASHTHSQYLTSFTETDPTVPSWAKTAAPSNIRYLKMNADNTITWRTAAQFRGDIGAGTSNFSGSYNDLSNKPTIPAAQVQSNWNATTGMGVILNKPNLATVATSGSYNDLSNKPSIPAGTVTNVSAGTTQVGGLTLSVATGGTTPVITTSINNAANFRAAIGAAPATHSHSIAQVTGLQAELDGKAASSHNHSGTYEPVFTKNTAFNKNFGTTAGTVVQGNDSRLTNARTPLSHTHAIADVTGLQTALDGKGTSNLTIGTTSTTAKAGNWEPTGTWKEVYSGPSGRLSTGNPSLLTLNETAIYYNKPMMMEIRFGSNSATFTQQIVTFTLGNNTITTASKTQPRTVSITDFDGQYFKTISVKVAVNTTEATNTLRVGPVKTLIGDFTGSTGNLTWTTESSDSISVYIGKIWVME